MTKTSSAYNDATHIPIKRWEVLRGKAAAIDPIPHEEQATMITIGAPRRLVEVHATNAERTANNIGNVHIAMPLPTPPALPYRYGP